MTYFFNCDCDVYRVALENQKSYWRQDQNNFSDTETRCHVQGGVDHLWQEQQCLVIRSRGHKEGGRDCKTNIGELSNWSEEGVDTLETLPFTEHQYGFKGHVHIFQRALLPENFFSVLVYPTREKKHDFPTQKPWQQGNLVVVVRKDRWMILVTPNIWLVGQPCALYSSDTFGGYRLLLILIMFECKSMVSSSYNHCHVQWL